MHGQGQGQEKKSRKGSTGSTDTGYGSNEVSNIAGTSGSREPASSVPPIIEETGVNEERVLSVGSVTGNAHLDAALRDLGENVVDARDDRELLEHLGQPNYAQLNALLSGMAGDIDTDEWANPLPSPMET